MEHRPGYSAAPPRQGLRRHTGTTSELRSIWVPGGVVLVLASDRVDGTVAFVQHLLFDLNPTLEWRHDRCAIHGPANLNFWALLRPLLWPT